MSSQRTQTIAFFGASGGVGLSALKHSLSAGNKCIALCRTPSKLLAIFPASSTPNLTIIEGNAHDTAAVSRSLQTSEGKLVDIVISTIGGVPKMNGLKATLDDPEVCQKGMTTLLTSLHQLRSNGITGFPHIICCSTLGMSRFGRDIAIPMIPVYALFVRVPRIDKTVMEDSLFASGERFTVVRPSHLTDGASEKIIKVGVEDPEKGPEGDRAIGYTISREDVGRWIVENLVVGEQKGMYEKKIASITY